MNIILRLKRSMVMSMFSSSDELYRAQEKERREAAEILSEIRELLDRINTYDRHAENGAYWVRMYYGDFEQIERLLRS
jgi:hypothetical protein